MGGYRTYPSLVNLQPGFWVCGGRPAFQQNCGLGSWVCSEGPVLGQNTLMILICKIICIEESGFKAISVIKSLKIRVIKLSLFKQINFTVLRDILDGKAKITFFFFPLAWIRPYGLFRRHTISVLVVQDLFILWACMPMSFWGFYCIQSCFRGVFICLCIV